MNFQISAMLENTTNVRCKRMQLTKLKASQLVIEEPIKVDVSSLQFITNTSDKK